MHVIFVSYFQRALAGVVTTKQYKRLGDYCGCQRVKGCLCVPSCLSFSKAPNGPTGDVILSQHQRRHYYTLAKKRDFLATRSFSVSMAGLNCTTGCVLTGQALKRIDAHMCNPRETTNRHGLR